MTDIVERLRVRRIRTNADALDLLQVCEEAADEIERLRNEIELLRAAQERLRDETMLMGEHQREIERLRELKTPASRELLNITKGCLDDAEAEIERLRAEIELVSK